MPTLSVILVVVGFIGWWATGIDDTLMLALLLRTIRRNSRTPVLLGHVSGVLIVLAVASAAALGLLQLEQGLVNVRFIGLPVQNFAGLLPIAVGVLALREALVHDDDKNDAERDDAVDDHLPSRVKKPASPRQRRWGFFVWSMVGLNVYLVNSVDDLALHLGVLAGVIRQSSGWSTVLLIAAFWIGNLIGEFTSLVAAHWLSVHFKARRSLEIGAALSVIAVGGAVLLLGR